MKKILAEYDALLSLWTYLTGTDKPRLLNELDRKLIFEIPAYNIQLRLNVAHTQQLTRIANERVFCFDCTVNDEQFPSCFMCNLRFSEFLFPIEHQFAYAFKNYLNANLYA